MNLLKVANFPTRINTFALEGYELPSPNPTGMLNPLFVATSIWPDLIYGSNFITESHLIPLYAVVSAHHIFAKLSSITSPAKYSLQKHFSVP